MKKNLCIGYKMVYRKRTFKRKRIMRRRRRFNIPRVPRYSAVNVVKAKRTFFYENWTPSTASTTGFWRYYQPTLNMLPSLSEFSALFDQYKLSAIKITLRPRYDNFAGNDTTDVTLPGTTAQGGTNVHVLIDPDTTTTVPSGTYTSGNLNTFLENGAVRSYTGLKPINIYWKPKVGSAMSVGESRVKAPWCGTGTNPVQIAHHGVHIFLQDTNFTGTFNQSFDVFITYYMQFKALK